MYKHFYTEFLKANEGKVHFAAHSHHYWPDVTKQAVLDCWNDSCKLVDDKWNKWFSTDIPKAQQHIANILNFNRPNDIAFNSNVHGFINRLFSCLDHTKTIKILTTDSEFHSFERQLRRWSENGNIEIDRIKLKSVNEHNTFIEQAKKYLNNNQYDFIYLSTGLYNSGLQIPAEWIEQIINLVSEQSIFALDGYHTFAAVPYDLSKIQDKVFFLGGSYKYAQGGEGLCFMTLPKDCDLRPTDTGWFAHFEGLSGEMSERIGYTNGGLRFWGATVDMTALFRFNAAWDLFKINNLTVEKSHQYIQNLMQLFIDKLPSEWSQKLICNDLSKVGHFLTFEFPNEESTSNAYQSLKQKGILTDYRNNRLRFGFGLNLDEQDILQNTCF